MSGHSHWSRIKHKKAVTDARRGKSWSKLARAITMSAKNGGNPNDNPRLRLAIDKARAENMPKDTIEKAIKKGTGEIEGVSYEEVLYEGYASGGVAVMCQATTDNRNRTSGEIRKVFERGGGNLGSTNCVSFMFNQKGLIAVSKDAASEEKLMEIVLEAGADDIETLDDGYEITCSPDAFEGVRQALKDAEIETETADLSMLADNTVTLDLKGARKVLRLVDALEEQDDVDNVYTNSDIPADVLAELAKE